MKKFTTLLISIIALSFSLQTPGGYAAPVTFDDGTTWNCDQHFSPVVLRYGYYQGFFDTFHNNNASIYTNYINTFDVQYQNASYLGAGGAFDFTPELVNQGYAIGPNQSLRILSTTDNNWRVVRHPATRSTGQNYDFQIAYRIGYDTSNNYPDASDDSYHIECQPYQVSWCGDGVVDSQYGESCDE